MDAERAHLQRMIKLLSSNLYAYEEQAARFGKLHVPPHIEHQIEETRADLERFREQLANLDMSRSDQRIAQTPGSQLPGVIVEIRITTETSHPAQVIRADGRMVVAIYLSKTGVLSPIIHLRSSESSCFRKNYQPSSKPECAWQG